MSSRHSRQSHPSLQEMSEDPVVAAFIADGMTYKDVDPLALYALWMIRHCPPKYAPPLPTRNNKLRRFMQLSNALKFPTLMPHQVLFIAGMTELAEGHPHKLKFLSLIHI